MKCGLWYCPCCTRVYYYALEGRIPTCHNAGCAEDYNPAIPGMETLRQLEKVPCES